MKRALLVMMAAAIICIGGAVPVSAHDGWIQSNVSRVTTGDMVYIDMQFGNHQNMHRDYLIYGSKWDLRASTFVLHTPDKRTTDLGDRIIDIGKDETKIIGGVQYTDKNGYLVTSFQTDKKGIYIVDARQDTVVSYAPERSIKCAKSIVGSVEGSTKSNPALDGFDQTLGQVLEIIPLKDTTNLRVGDTLPFRVLYKGEPLEDGHISVIPRGTVLPEMGTPNPYDLMTDSKGKASFTFSEANYHLIVAHHETDESGVLNGKSYSFTKYTGDLTVIVSPKPLQDSGNRNWFTRAIDSVRGFFQTVSLSIGNFFSR
ncbi:MAG: DUF4198 domain-containing protein [Dehalogenimonas sp.]